MPEPIAPPALYHPAALASGLLWLAAVLYLFGLATIFLRRSGHPERRYGERVDHVPAILGFAAHLASILVAWRTFGRLPVGNLTESAVFLAFLLACAYLWSTSAFRFPAVEVLLLVLVVAFLGLSFALPAPTAAPTSADQGSRWFVFHTLLSFLGVTALVGASVVSALYLLADGQLKNKRPGPWLRFLPSLVACDRMALRLLVFGFPLLTLGIVSGVIWLREAGRAGPWSWGPKELSAVVAWCITAVLLFVRVARGWHGRRAAILSVSAAAAALGAVLGIRH